MLASTGWTKHKPRTRSGTWHAFAVICALVFILLGAFPIVPMENDGMRIALGVQSKILYGDYRYRYNYGPQAGTYKLLEALGAIIPLDPFTLFSYLTAISCLIFLICTALFIRRSIGSTFWICLASLLLFQESYVSGYYPNSSMIAAAFLSCAFLVTGRKERAGDILISGVLFAIAVWVRFDAVLLSGALLVHLWKSGAGIPWRMIVFVITSTSLWVLLILLSSVSVGDLLTSYTVHTRESIDIKRTLNIYTTIFSLAAIFFFTFGSYRLFRARSWRMSILILAGILPPILAYGLSLTTPKYLLYTLIFFAFPIGYGINLLVRSDTRNAERVLLAGLVLLAGQYIFTPPYELVLRRSTVIDTADEARLRGAIAFTPAFWAEYRRTRFATDHVFQAELEEYIARNNHPYLISHDWMMNQWLLYFFHEQGYRIMDSTGYADILEDGERIILAKELSIIHLVRWRPEIKLDFPVDLQDEIRAQSSVLYIGPYHKTTNFAQESVLGEIFEPIRLSEWGRIEVILLQR